MNLTSTISPLFFALLLSFCSQKGEFPIDQWSGKRIRLPEELCLLEGTRLFNSATCRVDLTQKKKVISIVDATCPTCILGQLNRTDSLFHTFLDSSQAVLLFVLNVNSEDSTSFMVSMQPLITAKGLIFWDSNYYFETLNDLFTPDLSRRTFLLDEENEIILVGNPLFDPKLLSNYKTLTNLRN